jgi:hypothetical protein
MQTLAGQMIREGKPPLWNPLILSGIPLLANFQSVPFTIITNFIFDSITSWSVQIILQHILAAFFTYLLLRHWKLSNWASVIGGIVFAFSGFNLIWSQWNGHTLAAAFIPLLLFFEDRFLKSAKFMDGIGVTLVLLLQVLSGYPQVVLYTGVAMVSLWLFRIEKKREWFIKTVFLIVFSVLAIGLAAPQILPGAELLSFSQRELEPHPFEWAFLPWTKIITFLAPDYFGNHATQNYWGPQDYTSNTGFVGVVAFILASLSLVKLRESKEKIFLITILAISLILSFPTPVSIFLWKSGILGLNAASAHRALVLFNLAVASLAAFGIERLRQGFKFKFRWIVIPFLVLAGYGLYALSLKGVVIRGIPITRVALRNLVLPTGAFLVTSAVLWTIARWRKLTTLGIIFLSLVIVLELFRFGWKFTPFSPKHIVFPTTPVLDFLIKQEKPFRVTGSRVIPINMRMPYGLESLEGYDAVYPLRISQFLAAINGGRSGTDPLGRYGTVDDDTSHLLDLVNTRYYLALKRDKKGDPNLEGQIHDRFKTKRFKPIFEDKTTVVLESKSVLPRAFMVYDWEVIKEDRKILDRLLDPSFPIGSKIILEDPPSLKLRRGKEKYLVDYQKYEAQESLVKVKTEKDGLLFVSDAYYPGWKAYVDGQEAKIYRADFAFRAILIPSGSHEVHFIYQPESFFNGLRISALSIVLLVSLYPIYKKLRSGACG